MPEKRRSAFIRATQEAQEHAALTPTEPPLPQTSHTNTVSPSHSETVTKPGSSTTEKKSKVSFYLSPEQEEKLNDLEVAFWQQHKKRINRNDIVRYLIDHCSIHSLEGLIDEQRGEGR